MAHLLLAVIYLSFISLGLPDSLLGSAWPSMYMDFGVPVSCAGAIAMIISAGTGPLAARPQNPAVGGLPLPGRARLTALGRFSLLPPQWPGTGA